MRPCDCKDARDLEKLQEQGIGFNESLIRVAPNIVVLTSGSCSMKISQKMFNRFAVWYLEDQPDKGE